MPCYSSSYTKFCQNIVEVQLLQKEAKKLSKKIGTKSYDLSAALCRSGVMLLCAHVEAYFEDITAEILQQADIKRVPKAKFGKAMLVSLSADLIQNIIGTEMPDKRAVQIEELFRRDADIWAPDPLFNSPIEYERITKVFNSPRFKNMKKLMNVIGFNKFEGNIRRRLQNKAEAHIQMMDSIVDKRNSIAHGNNLSVTHYDLEQMLAYAKVYCNRSDLCICDWARDIGCGIR